MKSTDGSKPAISFVSVSKRYNKDVPLLEDVTFSSQYGEIAIVVGPSGSGKSTILEMASALLFPDSGQILLDGNELTANRKTDLAELRRSLISYLPQEDYLLESLNVFDNVALALDLYGDFQDRDDKVRRALNELGIDALTEKSIDKISSGEKRRCAIARALVRESRILIMDEPTSSLDSEKTIELMKALKNNQEARPENQKMAVLIATHDVLELEPFADTIYQIKNHKLYGPS